MVYRQEAAAISASPSADRLATENTATMTDVVEAVRDIVRRGLAPESTAELTGRALRPVLGEPALLTAEQCAGDPHRYRQHVLHAEEDGSFSVVALVWLPGQETAIHDHVSWCVTGVHQGRESERRYRLAPDGRTARLSKSENVINPAGAISWFAPPGDIHRVRNAGDGKAISIHVYGADITRLGSSIRRTYSVPAGQA